MGIYKCIGCGAEREYEEECSCTVCGYRMFAVPYDRKEQIRKEILELIGKLKCTEVSEKDIKLYRKEKKEDSSEAEEPEIILKSKDDQHFPDFKKIQGYICHAQKTEELYDRLDETLTQLKRHIHTPYARDYLVSADALIENSEDEDDELKNVLETLNAGEVLPDLFLPKITAAYTETPDSSLLDSADELLDAVLTLAEKIRRFIKQNNIYGRVYRDAPGNVLSTVTANPMPKTFWIA